MKVFSLALLSTLALLVFSGCTKDADNNTTTTTPLITGSMVGYVDLYDQYGNILSNASGISVSAGGKTAVTDANGKYSFAGLPIGYYNVFFTKAGFGNAEATSQQLIGADTLYITGHRSMSRIPDFSANSLTLSLSKNYSNIIFSGAVSKVDTKTRKIIFFVNDSNAVSSSAALYKYAFTANVLADSTNFSTSLPVSTLYSSGFGSGSTIYVAAYGSAYQSGSSSTFNTLYGRTQFNALSASTPAISSIILP